MSQPTLDDRLMGAVELLRRDGAREFQLRFTGSDDDPPIMWVAMVRLDDDEDWRVAGALIPDDAIFTLCRDLFGESMCPSCDKLMMFDPSEMELELFPDRCAVEWNGESYVTRCH